MSRNTNKKFNKILEKDAKKLKKQAATGGQ